MTLAPDGNRIAILGSSRYSQSVVGLLLNIHQVTSLSRNGHVMLKSQSKDNKKMQTNQKVTQNQGRLKSFCVSFSLGVLVGPFYRSMSRGLLSMAVGFGV